MAHRAGLWDRAVAALAEAVTELRNDDSFAHPDFIFEVPGVAVLKWEPLSRAIHIEWQGWANPTEFRAALDAGYRALRLHGSSRWLADCLNMKVVQRSDQEWLDQDWFPRMLAAGLLQMAVVIPASGLAKMNVEEILARVPGTELDVGYFPTVQEAKVWLTRPAP
ncbi:MAG: hypothetical protein PVS2B1_15720 [Candidatus Dormibacteraceae bacterium]